MPLDRRLWLLFAALQLVGVILDFAGEQLSVLIQALALLLLIPGSLIASFLPLHALWFPYLWTRFETDATGLATVLFLPTTVLINVIFFLIARYYFRRRAALRAG